MTIDVNSLGRLGRDQARSGGERPEKSTFSHGRKRIFLVEFVAEHWP
jgi:hypothetical protein